MLIRFFFCSSVSLFLFSGDFRAAIEDYSRAIELAPNHFKAYFNRGFSYDKLGMYEKAIEDYTQALRV